MNAAVADQSAAMSHTVHLTSSVTRHKESLLHKATSWLSKSQQQLLMLVFTLAAGPNCCWRLLASEGCTQKCCASTEAEAPSQEATYASRIYYRLHNCTCHSPEGANPQPSLHHKRPAGPSSRQCCQTAAASLCRLPYTCSLQQLQFAAAAVAAGAGRQSLPTRP